MYLKFSYYMMGYPFTDMKRRYESFSKIPYVVMMICTYGKRSVQSHCLNMGFKCLKQDVFWVPRWLSQLNICPWLLG